MPAAPFFDTCTALVPVRGGSKGLPGKNLRKLAGTPLYQHAVRQGQRHAARCVVSTDISEILRDTGREDCEVLRRPADLANDTTPMDDVIRHAIDTLEIAEGTMLLLQATSPLRLHADIQAACDLFESGEHDLVMSVCRTDSSILKYGLLDGPVFNPVAGPAYCFSNRQALPDVYRPNGAIYVFGIDWFRRNGGLAADKIGAVVMPEDRSIDIDTLADFEKVEAAWTASRGSDVSTDA